MIRSSVDLPEPLGPSSAVSEPSGTSSVTSSSAAKSPNRLEIASAVDPHLASPFSGPNSVIASSTISDITASSVAAAYAPVIDLAADLLRRAGRRSSGSVSVEPATFEDTTATAPISPSARAVVSTTP